jgi:outer membrane protein assembly factor BamB
VGRATEGDLLIDQLEMVMSVGPFVQATFRPRADFGVTGGVRYDRYNFEATDHFLEDGDQSGDRRLSAASPMIGVAWTHRTERPLAGGTLVTAGGLVFAGRSTGWFDAYDAATGERVWSFRTGAGCNAAPATYRIAGVQHVVIACGGHGNLDPRGGNALIAFALPPG